MITPKESDYKKIQGGVMDYLAVHMSVCGSGCSCPCKQSASIDVRKYIMNGTTCSCNCTCGCNCKAPVFLNSFSDKQRRIFK